MKYNGVYEVDHAFTEGGSIKWRSTGNGEYVIARRSGKKYFVKRNMHARYPARGEPKAVYDKYKAEADALHCKQQRLHALMKGTDWETDHIVAEEENFWDGEKMYATITPCVPDALPDTYDYTALSFESFRKLAYDTAAALNRLHGCGVIHGDLKPKNILVAMKKGIYTPYIIDFDSSYPADAIPEWESIGGSEGYQSPEILLYGSDEGAAPKTTVTAATDIFSLGVTFHKWWTGSFPGVDLERGSAGTAVYLDKEVIIDKKFNVRIGKNCGATFQSLINWMLAKVPADRPTAKQVADVLADKSEVPEAYHTGGDEKPFDEELWEAHKLIAELLPADELRKLGVRSLKRINEGGGSASLKYRIVTKDGVEKSLDIIGLCSAGYAKGKEADIEEAWPEHKIEFESAAVIARKGYAKISKILLAFRKRYLITTASGREFDKGCEWLIAEGLVKPKLAEVQADTPWPEHGNRYCLENMARFGVKSISRMEIGGEHRYKIVYDEVTGGKNKINERVPANNLKLMGFIK